MILVATRETLVGPVSYHGGWTIGAAPASSSFDWVGAVLFVIVIAWFLFFIANRIGRPLDGIYYELSESNRLALDAWRDEYVTDRISKPKPVRRK